MCSNTLQYMYIEVNPLFMSQALLDFHCINASEVFEIGICALSIPNIEHKAVEKCTLAPLHISPCMRFVILLYVNSAHEASSNLFALFLIWVFIQSTTSGTEL